MFFRLISRCDIVCCHYNIATRYCQGSRSVKKRGLGDVKVKKFLNNVLQAELAPIRQRREDWEKRLPDVYEILRTGSETARNTAASTLRDVRHAMRIDYFEDNNLLRQD